MNEELQQLMRYCDSELEPAERARVALRLLRDVEHRWCLDEWRIVGDVVRMGAPAKHAWDDSIEQSVMSRLDALQPPTVERARGARWRGATRLALAAGCLLAIGLGADRYPGSTGRREAMGSESRHLLEVGLSSVRGPRLAHGTAQDEPPLAIERVDLGGRSGAIFLVSAGDIETPVVWLNDDEPGGRIRNL